MSAPHFHSTKEARAAIKSIEHNAGGFSGKPALKDEGSASNQTTQTPRVTETHKGSDWVNTRKP